MRPVRRAVVIVLLIGLAAGPACGDKAPTRQAYVAKANPVCKRAGDAAAVFTNPTSVSGIKELAGKLADTTGKTVAELEKLKAPGGQDGDAARALVKALRDAAAAARALGPLADKDDYAALELGAKAMADGYKAADDKARALGSSECGRGEYAAAAKLTETVGPTLKDTYVVKADALCSTARTQVLAIDQPETLDEAKAYLDKTLPIGKKLHDDVRALPAPSFEKSKLDEVFAAWDDLLATGNRVAAAVNAEDEDEVQTLFEDFADQSVTLRAKTAAYGFHTCGQN